MWNIAASHRSRRVSLGAGAAAASAILLLTSCGAQSTAVVSDNRLGASSDSDVLEAPTDQVYELSDFSISDEVPFASTLSGRLDYAGTMTLRAGIITEAEFSASLGDAYSSSFTLTEPATLNVEDGTDTRATGTVVVNGVEQAHTVITFTPVAFTDDSAVFDVSTVLPTGLLNGTHDFEQATAQVTFTAR